MQRIQSKPIIWAAVVFMSSVLVLVFTQFVAQLAWHVPAYDVTFNNISDLGNVKCGPWSDDQRYVCSPRHAIANLGFIVGGVLFLIGVAMSRGLWKPTKVGKTAHTFLYGGGILWLMAGLWPADVNEALHLVGWLWLLLAEVGLIMSFAGMRLEVPKIIRTLAPIIGMLGILLSFAFLGNHFFGLGRGTIERLVVYSVAAWSVLLSIWVLKNVRIR